MVTRDDIVRELISRGYSKRAEPSPPPPPRKKPYVPPSETGARESPAYETPVIAPPPPPGIGPSPAPTPTPEVLPEVPEVAPPPKPQFPKWALILGLVGIGLVLSKGEE